MITRSSSAPDEAWRARVRHFLERSRLADIDAPLVPLTGDASNRRYVRVIPRERRSFVLALYSESFKYETLPFIMVASLLDQMRIPVPAVLEHAADLGVLALEDLGDVTLQAHLGTGSAADHLALYREAVDVLGVLQRKGRELAAPGITPFTLAFDVDKLLWELLFFVEHFLEGYRGVSLEPETRARLVEEFERLVGPLAAEPRVLCHRDYHSRNLMVHAGRLFVIDFQDARMGPAAYDLVSLLRDSYADLPEPTIEELVERFLSRAPDPPRPDEFRRRFDAMALQRNLKALGTFGYQTSVHRNPVYIQYISRTLHYVRGTFERNHRFDVLRRVLAPLLPELG